MGSKSARVLKDRSYKNKSANNERKDENLRGKVRELQKEIHRQQRIIQSLQNELVGKSPKDKPPKEAKKKNKSLCSDCGFDELEVRTIWHPVKGDTSTTKCKRCGFVQDVHKISSNSRKS